MSKRRLANTASQMKTALMVALTRPDSFAVMRELYERTQNGWSSDNYGHYVKGTKLLFRRMKCVAATVDAIRLLDHAAKSLPDDMDLFDMRPEVPSGFLWLAEPLMSGSWEVAAYMWVTLPFADENGPGAVLIIGTFNPEGGFGATNWNIYGERTLTNIRDSFLDSVPDEARDDAMTDLRLVVAFNLLLAQKVTDTEEIQPARQIQRQAHRNNVTLDPVTIVQLPVRAHASVNGAGDAHIDWSHRWIVSGHWRKQWYPSTETHRPKWITPYVKGPDDKPLIVKEKLYVFDPSTISVDS